MALTTSLVYATALLSLAQALAVNTPTPMLVPAFPTCEQFIQAVEGDTCEGVVGRANVRFDEFVRLNPVLGEGGWACKTNGIVPGYWYCLKAVGQDVLPLMAPAEPSPPGPEPSRPEPTSTRPKPTKDKKPSSTAEKPPSKTEEPPEPTEPPKTSFEIPSETFSTCEWGSCWKSWIKLSTAKDNYEFTSATNSCHRLKTTGCEDVNDKDFPEKLLDGCDSCEKLSSGCACMDAGLYHTYTVGYLYEDGYFR